MARQKNRRRKLLVAGPVQWALIRQAMWHWVLYCVTIITLLAMIRALSVPQAMPFLVHWQAMLPTVVVVFMALCAALPLFIYEWLKISNRFAGPVERLRGALRDLADGKEVADVRFRDDDFWRQMAGELNAAMQVLAKGQTPEETPMEEPAQPILVLNAEPVATSIMSPTV